MKDYSRMPRNELLQEKAKIDIALKGTEYEKLDKELVLFYDFLDSYFYDNLKVNLPPLVTIRNTKRFMYQHLILLHNNILTWLNNCIKKRKPTRNERIRVYVLVIELLANKVTSNNIPLSLTTFLNFRDYFPGIIEQAFPGYVNAGLIDFMLRRKPQKKPDAEDLV